MKNSITISETRAFLKFFLATFAGIVIYIFGFYKLLELIVAILIGMGVKSIALLSAIIIYVFCVMFGLSMGTLTFILIIGFKVVLNEEGLFIYSLDETSDDVRTYKLYKSLIWKEILPATKKASEKTKAKLRAAFDKAMDLVSKDKSIKIEKEEEIITCEAEIC